jgi:hypothetical protein
MYIYSVTKKTLNQEKKEDFMFNFKIYCAFIMPRTVDI